MLIELPDGVSQGIAVVLAVGWLIFGILKIRTSYAGRVSERTYAWSLRIPGLVAGAGALLFALRFVPLRDLRAVPYSFYLEEAVIFAALVASLGVAFARSGWRMPGVFVSGWGGLTLVLKPILLPLLSTRGATPTPFGLTSETHLYFLVPGIGLLALFLILLVPLRHRLMRPAADEEEPLKPAR